MARADALNDLRASEQVRAAQVVARLPSIHLPVI